MSTTINTITLRGRGRRAGTRVRILRQKTKVTFPPLQHSYTDDEADLELKSEDGVVFKVESFYLKAASGVFRSMLTSSAAAHGATTKTDLTGENITMAEIDSTPKQPPIEISCPSLILRLFIDLMHHDPLLSDPREDLLQPTPFSFPDCYALSPTGESDPDPDQSSSSHFTDLFRPANAPLRGGSVQRHQATTYLLDILDQFECGIGMRERALAHFEPNFDMDPWGIFVIAGRYDDVPLSRKAIKLFSKVKAEVEPKMMSTEQAGSVPFYWLMAYWRAHGDVKQERRYVSVIGKQCLSAGISVSVHACVGDTADRTSHSSGDS